MKYSLVIRCQCHYASVRCKNGVRFHDTYCVLEKKVKYNCRKFNQFFNIERSKSQINNRKAVNSILIWHFNEINLDNRLYKKPLWTSGLTYGL